MRSQIGLLKHQDKKEVFKKKLWLFSGKTSLVSFRHVPTRESFFVLSSLSFVETLSLTYVRSVTIPSEATLTNYATASPVGFYFENKNIYHPRRGGAQRVR